MTNNIISTNLMSTLNNIASDVYLIGKTNAVKATDFVIEQAPILGEEYLNYLFFDSLISAILFGCITLIVLIFSIIFLKKAFKYNFDLLDDKMFPFFIIMAFLFMISPLYLGGFITNTKQCIKIKVAPRVVLIEKAVGLFKK